MTLWMTAPAAPPLYDRWETFGIASGLPSDKVFCIRAMEKEVWAGTDHGLARYSDGQWRTYGVGDGLAHEGVLAIAEDPQTGDLWIGTMGGLSRYSAGRLDTFTQFNSGLANNVVNGVAVQNGEVWAATFAGASRYEIAHNRWTIYDETNTPMHEIWCYSAAGDGEKMYLAVWGGGLLEYTPAKDRWKDYRDPDREMEIDLFRNDGLLIDVVAGVACDSRKRVWVSTYFGLNVYDGRRWQSFMDHDSPLTSNFINFVTTQGEFAWLATDNGLSATDGNNWWTYRRDDSGKGVVRWTPHNGAVEEIRTETIFPHNYILGANFQAESIWLATEAGVARGRSSHAEGSRVGALIEPDMKKNESTEAEAAGEARRVTVP